MLSKSKLTVVMLAALMLTGCGNKEEVLVDTKPNEALAHSEETPKPESSEAPTQIVKKDFFIPMEIPSGVQSIIIGNSYPKDADPNIISLNDLRLLNIKYYGFDDRVHEDGAMIVNKDVAEEVGDIFKELYEKKYPIQKVNLIDDYNSVDLKSMMANNTSAFCYRTIEGTDVLSNHSFGRAIDINPLMNPQVLKDGSVYPFKASKYADRNKSEKGMIKKGDDCYNAFISRGWEWGGDWNSTKDYQHFEKR